jgi:peroxiredoxin/DNA-binding SARP family transcriptional activator
MKTILKFNLLLFTVLLISCTTEKEKFLEIKGRVVNTDTKSILLVKPNQDMRFDSLIEIPIDSGIFYYKSKLEHPEAVNLFLGEAKNIGGRFMPLFLENEKIDLTIHSEDEFDKNIVSGGKLNSQYKKYKQNFEAEFNDRVKPLQDSISALFEKNEYNSDTVKELYNELRESKSQDKNIVIYKKIDDLRKADKHLSPKAKVLEAKLKPIYEEQKRFQQEYIENNPTIVSYSFLLQDLIYNAERIDIDLAKKNHQKLSKANPNHPYNDLALNLLNAIENIKVGKKYIDFSAPDLNGNIVKLSDEIDGQIAVLDLWATWCGPCIAKSRTMVPLYNEYKDQGFTIVGVAGEFKNTDRLIKFFEKEKWPWLNLVELDEKNNIWQKYGVDGGGGGIFLIDKNGEILAINPTAEEVRKQLEKRLN